MECLYSLIEMSQFQDWLSDNDKLGVVNKNKEEYRYNRIQFPSNVPISEMLSGKDINVKMITKKIYEKYVKNGSIYEINISFVLRNRFAQIVESQQMNNDNDWDWNQLMHVLDKCNHANKTLLMYSLTRFKQSEDFEEVRQIYRDHNNNDDGQLQIITN